MPKGPSLDRNEKRLAVHGLKVVEAQGFERLATDLTSQVTSLRDVLSNKQTRGAFGQGRMGDRSRLDERQRAMNERALAVSYGVMTVAVTVVLGVVWMAAAWWTWQWSWDRSG